MADLRNFHSSMESMRRVPVDDRKTFGSESGCDKGKVSEDFSNALSDHAPGRHLRHWRVLFNQILRFEILPTRWGSSSAWKCNPQGFAVRFCNSPPRQRQHRVLQKIAERRFEDLLQSRSAQRFRVLRSLLYAKATVTRREKYGREGKHGAMFVLCWHGIRQGS